MTTRTEYRKARRLFRDNGRYSLKWMTPAQRAVFQALLKQQDDPFAEVAFFFRGHTPAHPHDRLRFRYAHELHRAHALDTED